MIITDSFVVLNYPRTGSTFVRQALAELYRRKGSRWSRASRWLRRKPALRDLQLPILRTDTAARASRYSQHGAYSQIPAADRHKTVVSVARHPLDRVVSIYEAGFWRSHPPADPDAIRAALPGFPDLSFTEFLTLQRRFDRPNVLRGAPLQADVGAQTIHFLRFYHPRPDEALRSLTSDRLDDGSLLAELPSIRWLRLERLTADLAALLRDNGFDARETERLEQRERVNVAAARKQRQWHSYFGAEEEARYRQEERFVFDALGYTEP